MVRIHLALAELYNSVCHRVTLIVLGAEAAGESKCFKVVDRGWKWLYS